MQQSSEQVHHQNDRVSENLGAILKDRVESRLHDVGAGPVEALRQALTTELQIMAEDLDLFRRLLHSFPARIKAVEDAGGGHTPFWFHFSETIEIDFHILWWPSL